MDVTSVKSQAPHAARKVESKPRPEVQAEQAAPPKPKPRPVVNTQGQTTGRVLNATA